jgi:hypothetical protein
MRNLLYPALLLISIQKNLKVNCVFPECILKKSFGIIRLLIICQYESIVKY